MNVLPDIHLCPVRERKHAQTFTLVNLSVEHIPQFRTLVSGIPLPAFVPEGENALFRPRTLLVATGSSDGRVKSASSESVQERGRFQRPTTALCAPRKRIGTLIKGRLILMNN